MTEAAIGGGVTGVLLLGAAARLRGIAAAAAEWPGAALAPRRRGALRRGRGGARGRRAAAARSRADARAGQAAANLRGDRRRQSGHRRADGLSRARHAAGEGGAGARPDRRVVAGAGPPLGRHPGAAAPARPDEALVFLARLLPPVGIVVGVYLLWVGADEPGGAFQGGALLAAMWLLAMMAGLAARARGEQRRLRLALVAGPAVFLAIGLAGFALADAFLAYPGGLRQAADHRHRGRR